MNMSFDAVAYRGKFREDQEQLLRRVHRCAENSKIHLITPPGSDKYALGLEILRYLKNPALILSASPTTCAVWCDRLLADFLLSVDENEREAYISRELSTPALLTAITYEALAAAFSPFGSRAPDAEGPSHADVIQYVHTCGIRTILLDDPHHIGDTGMGALESFFGVLGGEVQILTMNSTLPYDVKAAEWTRMHALCGDVDMEVRLPEMVRVGALSPHQDYVYINYPTADEGVTLLNFRVRAEQAVAAAMKLSFAVEINQRLLQLRDQRTGYLDKHQSEIGALLRMLIENGHTVSARLIKDAYGQTTMRPLTLGAAEEAIQFLLDSQSILRKAEREELADLLTDYRVLENGCVHLAMNSRTRRILNASLGKHESIGEIIKLETEALGDRLRAVILTASLTPEELSIAGTNERLMGMGMISVFESLRRRFAGLPLGCVANEAVILPAAVATAMSRDFGQTLQSVPIGDSGYAFYQFHGRKELLDSLQLIFSAGYIRVLIGAVDLLAGHWDDSFVNTMIITTRRLGLAATAFLRGRVLQANAGDADKVANIWHLATVERPYSQREHPDLRLVSRLLSGEEGRGDRELEAVRRCFTCLLGPHENRLGIVSGLDRLGDIHAPRDEQELDAMNRHMCALAADRVGVAEKWRVATADPTAPVGETKPRYGKTRLVPEVYIPKTSRPPVFTMGHILLILAAMAAIGVGCYFMPILVTFCYLSVLVAPVILIFTVILTVVDGLVILWGGLYILHIFPLLFHLFPRYSIRVRCKAVYRAMRSLKLLDKRAVFIMQSTPDHAGYRAFVHSCNPAQQADFQMAISEMFSRVEEPRYVMVRSGYFHRYLWRWSCACPTVIGASDVSVKVFARYIHLAMGMMKFQYTRRDVGATYLLYTRHRSYLNIRHVRCERRIRQVWIAVKKPGRRKEQRPTHEEP